MNYALIENNVVANIIWLYPGNASDFPNAVPCDEIPVVIGDAYTDGVFYRNGERLLTAFEQLQVMLEDADAAEAAYREGVQDA